MILRLFRAGWFVSCLVVLATLLYVFAALPEQVVVMEEGLSRVMVSRDTFFYTFLFTTAVLNSLVYVMKAAYEQNENLRAWFHAQLISINIFFVVALSLLMLFNSGENFRYERVGFVLYGSLSIIILTTLSWPVIYFFSRKSAKEIVSQV